MSKTIICIMNGMAGSGKSTIQNKVMTSADSIMLPDGSEFDISIQSSVDIPYKCIKMLGWDGIKDDEFRSDMAALKQMYIRHCNGPCRDIVRLAMEASTRNYYNHIIFIDIREADEINKLKALSSSLEMMDIYIKTVLVRRKQVEDKQHGNNSDDHVLDSGIEYDIVIDNNNATDVRMFDIAHDLVLTLLGYKEGKYIG